MYNTTLPKSMALGLLLTIVLLSFSASTSSCDSPQYRTGTDYQSIAWNDAITAGIPPQLFVRQINQESGFQPYVISSAGAIGIAQIMPATASEWHVNAYDPVASLKAAASAMAWYVNRYGTFEKALACYNAGCPWLVWAENHCLNFYWCLPAETRHYIDVIMA
jgi:soluble lytic murein transglycosylase-like protein